MSVARSKTSEYNSWRGMITRCYNEKYHNYNRYGARGITVCDRWLESFENFLVDMGQKPSKLHSLDRRNNNGNYCKENCRWATKKEQSNNTINNKLITFNNKTLNISQWEKETGISRATISGRLLSGWTPERLLTVQVRTSEHSIIFNNETHNLLEWAEITGISKSTLSRRLNSGWSIEKMLTTPTKNTKRKYHV